jgi:hypothetical protein
MSHTFVPVLSVTVTFIRVSDLYGVSVLIMVLPFPPCLLIYLLNCPQLLLQLHSPILKPDFNLAFSETQCVCNLNTASSCEVMVEMKLLLQL